MSQDLKDNPFVKLFNSVSDAENYIRQRIESEAEPSEKSESKVNQQNTDLHEILEKVFLIGLREKSADGQLVVFMEEFANSQPVETEIDFDLIGQVLFERLLLDNLEENIVCCTNKSSGLYIDAIEKDIILYLFRCYMRLKECKAAWASQDTVKKVKGLIYRNINTALRQPSLFVNQSLSDQIIHLFCDPDIDRNEISSFAEELINDFLEDETEENYNDAVFSIFEPVIKQIHMEIARSTLFTVNRSCLLLLFSFSLNKYLAYALVKYSQPKDNIGFSYTETLFGSLLCLSCLPKRHDGLYEYFDKPMEQSAIQANVWTAIQFVNESLHTMFLNIIKSSPEARNFLLKWIGNCLKANSARGKLSNEHGLNLGSAACVTDGFILNLTSVLLHLCQPICSKSNETKILRVDPTYCAVTEPMAEKISVHMTDLSSETCLIPVTENTERPVADSYGFVSEIFFMTQRAMNLGFCVVHEHLIKVNENLTRLQRAYRDAQNQSGPQPDVIQTIREHMDMELSRFLSLRAALLEPNSLELLSNFHLASSVWLVQVALNTDINPLEKNSFAPGKMREVSFPLPDEVPCTLSCVPEFLIENVASFLSFARRINQRTLEEQGFDLLEPILTMVLVFMKTSKRIRNPHLRARLAECLESLIPHEDEEGGSTLGSFYRSQIFKEHPHKNQVVESLLDVFVGIEMTGQSVAFEQKFNYRRPMYVVMKYLWQIEEHRNCFKLLAQDAESNMEAVTPPLFLRFINLLMNDAVFLLDDALSNMAQLRQMQTAREAGEWQQLPANEHDQNEGYLQHIGMLARFDNILGRETISTLEFLTSEIKSIFTHSTMVDRIASMLNYFLYHLVGPKKKNFKVKDQKEYDFDPASIVLEICKIYVHLYSSDAFCLAVSQDGRSYSPQLFTLAEDVLVRIGGGSLIADLQAVAEKVASAASLKQTEDELLSDVPEEFLDPIMSTLMSDPVILPSSRQIVDRSTIARHLLSDQSDPFNRSPLTMDMIKPDDELRNKIQSWIKEQKEKNQK